MASDPWRSILQIEQLTLRNDRQLFCYRLFLLVDTNETLMYALQRLDNLPFNCLGPEVLCVYFIKVNYHCVRTAMLKKAFNLNLCLRYFEWRTAKNDDWFIGQFNFAILLVLESLYAQFYNQNIYYTTVVLISTLFCYFVL